MSGFVFKTKRKKNGKSVFSKYYYGRIRLDGEKKQRQFSLKTTDKQIAQKRLREIEIELQKEKEGIIPPKSTRDGIKKPLSEFLLEFISEKETLKRDSRYVHGLNSKITAILEDCNWQTFSDVSEDAFLAWRSKKNISPKALNEYLAAISQFFKWLKRKKRIPFNPLEDVQKIDARGTGEENRRSLSADEFERLLEANPQRRLVYLLAAYTGLRAAELAQLVWSDVRLTEASPYLVVRASTSKNRKSMPMPLHPDLVSALWDALPAEGGDIDAVPVIENGVPRNRDFVKDLERAGIPYIDSMGRKTPFHALRHYFATMMSKAGLPQRVVQELMRHSESRLTEKVYTDASHLPTFDAIKSLPRISVNGREEGRKDAKGSSNSAQETVIWSPKLSRGGAKWRLRKKGLAIEGQRNRQALSPSDTKIRWSGRKDSNLRPPGPKPGALPG